MAQSPHDTTKSLTESIKRPAGAPITDPSCKSRIIRARRTFASLWPGSSSQSADALRGSIRHLHLQSNESLELPHRPKNIGNRPVRYADEDAESHLALEFLVRFQNAPKLQSLSIQAVFETVQSTLTTLGEIPSSNSVYPAEDEKVSVRARRFTDQSIYANAMLMECSTQFNNVLSSTAPSLHLSIRTFTAAFDMLEHISLVIRTSDHTSNAQTLLVKQILQCRRHIEADNLTPDDLVRSFHESRTCVPVYNQGMESISNATTSRNPYYISDIKACNFDTAEKYRDSGYGSSRSANSVRSSLASRSSTYTLGHNSLLETALLMSEVPPVPAFSAEASTWNDLRGPNRHIEALEPAPSSLLAIAPENVLYTTEESLQFRTGSTCDNPMSLDHEGNGQCLEEMDRPTYLQNAAANSGTLSTPTTIRSLDGQDNGVSQPPPPLMLRRSPSNISSTTVMSDSSSEFDSTSSMDSCSYYTAPIEQAIAAYLEVGELDDYTRTLIRGIFRHVVDQVLCMLYNRILQIRETAAGNRNTGQSNTTSASQNNEPSQQQRSKNMGRKRPSGGGAAGDDEDDDNNMRRKRRDYEKQVFEGPPADQRRWKCLFHANDPDTCKSRAREPGYVPDFTNIKNVWGHITGKPHRPLFICDRCRRAFPLRADLIAHDHDNPDCVPDAHQPSDNARLTHEQLGMLEEYRKNRKMPDEQKWIECYKVIFSITDDNLIPAPCIESTVHGPTLSQYQNKLEGPFLQAAVTNIGDVFARHDQQLTDEQLRTYLLVIEEPLSFPVKGRKGKAPASRSARLEEAAQHLAHVSNYDSCGLDDFTKFPLSKCTPNNSNCLTPIEPADAAEVRQEPLIVDMAIDPAEMSKSSADAYVRGQDHFQALNATNYQDGVASTEVVSASQQDEDERVEEIMRQFEAELREAPSHLITYASAEDISKTVHEQQQDASVPQFMETHISVNNWLLPAAVPIPHHNAELLQPMQNFDWATHETGNDQFVILNEKTSMNDMFNTYIDAGTDSTSVNTAKQSIDTDRTAVNNPDDWFQGIDEQKLDIEFDGGQFINPTLLGGS